MRQVTLSSGIRNSWHREPIDGIGRDHGIDNNSPDCSSLKRYPASILAGENMGGVLISPCNHTSGLSFTYAICPIYTNFDIFNNEYPNFVSTTDFFWTAIKPTFHVHWQSPITKSWILYLSRNGSSGSLRTPTSHPLPKLSHLRPSRKDRIHRRRLFWSETFCFPVRFAH